jgi:hypothetical protein
MKRQRRTPTRTAMAWGLIATGFLSVPAPRVRAQAPASGAPLLWLPSADVEALPRSEQAIGSDPRAWRRLVSAGTAERHVEAFAGVDAVVRGGADRIEVLLTLGAGADPAAVELRFDDATGVETSGHGHAIVRTPAGDVVLLRPGVQVDAGDDRRALAAGWRDAGEGRVVLDAPTVKEPATVGFHALFLPEALTGLDRNADGRVSLDELAPAAPAALGGPVVDATKRDTLVVDNDTDGQADPGDTLSYDVRIDNAAGGPPAGSITFADPLDPNLTLVPGSINVSPLALDDAYQAIGHVTLNVTNPTLGILANDTEFLGGTFALTSPAPGVPSPTTGGGTVTVAADGTFSYTSPAGFAGPTDSFSYTITDTGGLTGTGTVTFTIAGLVWFIDRDAAPGGTGTQASPFDEIADVNGAGGAGDPDAANHILYLHDRAAAIDYVLGLELEPGQQLVGSGVPLVVGATTVLPATTPPTVEHAGGHAITLAAGATVSGLNVVAANDAAFFGTGALGTANVSSVAVTTSGSGAGLSLLNHTGTVTLAGTIAGSGSGAAALVDGGSGGVDLSAAPIGKTAGRVVHVRNRTGGTVTFGSVTGTASVDAVALEANAPGAVTAFSSGLNLTTTNARALFANNGGTVNLAGASSVLSATGAAAIDATGTTFGGGGSFATVSSANSTAEGVRLSNVTGALTMSGGAISGSAGTAFSLAQGNSAVTYGGSISKTSAGRAVDVTARTGGTATFSGPVTATGASTGINVSGPTAASAVSFTGAVDLGTSATRLTGGTALTVNHGGNASTTSFADLDVFTTGQAGINATNGGTLSITTGQVDAGGRALNLDGVGLGATLTQVVSAGSAAEGVRLNNASGTLSVTTTSVTNPSTQGISVAGTSAAVTFASGGGTTTVSGGGAQRILVGTTTGNVAFGNTTLSGGTDSVSLQNNSGGTRTFGTLSISGNGGVGFLHAVGGGSVTVSGAATIANPGGVGVQIDGNAAASAVAFNSTLAVTRTTAGPGVLLANAVTNLGSINLGALSVTTANGTAIQAGSATTITPLTTSGAGVLSATGGAAIDARGTSFAASFGNVSATGGAIPGLRLLGASGTLTMAGAAGTLTGHASAPTVQVDGGSVAASYAGTLTQNAAQRSVDVQNTTGGSVSVATVTAGAASTGVNINAANGGVSFTSLTHGTSGTRTNNQAVTINGGTGTYNLGTVSIFTSGAGGRGIFAANADGTLASAGGVVNAQGAAAIDVDGPVGLTTLGLALTSLHANGGSSGALVRDTNGTLTVTGAGVAGSGGIIQNTTQRGARFTNATGIGLGWMNFTNNGTNQDAAATCGDALNGTNTNCGAGIDLQGVTGVTLDRLALSGGTQMGINGNNVTNLVITNSTVQNVGDEVNEDGVQLVNLKGTCTMTDATFSGNFHRQLELQNSGAANGLTSLSVTRVTFNRGTYVSTAAQGLLVAGHNGAVMNVTVRDSDFLNNFGAGFFAQGVATTATYTLGDVATAANGNVFTNNSLAAQLVSDGGAYTATLGNNAHTVSGTVTSGATPFTFRKANPATGLYVGNFIANQVGNATVQSGTNCNGCNGLSITNEGVSGNQRMTVSNNTIRNVNQRGMEAILQLDDVMGVVVTNNTIQDPFDQPNHIGQAIFAQSNTDSTDNGSMCMEVEDNVIGGSWDLAVGVGARNIRLRQAGAGGTAPLRLRNLVGGTATDANNFLTANNTNPAPACTAATAFTGGSAPCF